MVAVGAKIGSDACLDRASEFGEARARIVAHVGVLAGRSFKRDPSRGGASVADVRVDRKKLTVPPNARDSPVELMSRTTTCPPSWIGPHSNKTSLSRSYAANRGSYAANREAAAHGADLWRRVPDQARPECRVVTSWTIQLLPSGSLKAKKDP